MVFWNPFSQLKTRSITGSHLTFRVYSSADRFTSEHLHFPNNSDVLVVMYLLNLEIFLVTPFSVVGVAVFHLVTLHSQRPLSGPNVGRRP